MTFNVSTEHPWVNTNFRAFFSGINTVAEYAQNLGMREVTPTEWTQTLSYHPYKNGNDIEAGDLIEFEIGVFLRQPVAGRTAYYSRAFLYHVGEGRLEPWEGEGDKRDSVPLPDRAKVGGDLTISRNHSDEADQMLMQLALNIAPENAQPFLEGRRLHHSSFATGEHSEPGNPDLDEVTGLVGPHWVNTSCNGCHNQNARSFVVDDRPLNTMVFKTDQGDLGTQLQTVNFGSIESEAEVSIGHYEYSDVTLDDGTTVGLSTPVFSFDGVQPGSYSPRMAPPLIGMGLLEAIDEADILALADPDDADGDGISGVARVVTDAVTGDLRLGRFGWQAAQPTVRQQIAAALNAEMGVTTTIFDTLDCGSDQQDCSNETENPTVELPDHLLDPMQLYVSLLGVPARRNYDDAQVEAGEEIFEQLGCDHCHTKTFVTSDKHDLAELRNQTIHPYTDLLLHDMGADLAATLAEPGTTNREWRTAPLWALTRSPDVNRQTRYLHDGRAQTIEEAILWHGGEAETSKTDYTTLSPEDRQALQAFLESL